MRQRLFFAAPLILAAVLAGAMLVPRPAAAQIAAPMPAAATMPPTPPPVFTPLAIPMPPGATVQVEMDIHDADLLGVFKSFLRGIGQAAQAMPSTPVLGKPTHAAALGVQMAQILSNADLSDIFKSTTHVHMEVFSVPGSESEMMHPTVKTLKGKAIVAPAPAAPPSLSDQTPLYETAFGAEGGQRILIVNTPLAHVLMTSFGHDGGYALMVQMPGTVAVLRADGYPDLSKLSALATQVGAVAAQEAVRATAASKPGATKPKPDDD